MIAEIIGPDGRVHYRRPANDPMVAEAKMTPGYSVRLVEQEAVEMPFHDLADVDPVRYNQFL